MNRTEYPKTISTWKARIALALLLAACATMPIPINAADLGGAVVKLEGHQGSATVSARLVGPWRMQITVDPGAESGPLAIRVELPTSGPHAWPVADVEVRDAQGHARLVRRAGTEWSKLLVPVPAEAATYVVQATTPPEATRPLPSEKERWLAHDGSGLRLGIARWYDDRKAALSIRFDDSHPTHLTKAIPILREYGFRGTFMVNPGEPEPGSRRRSDFRDHEAEWAACARQGDHELANHTAHHRGAADDDDMEAEIGQAAQAIWKLTPGKSKLMALNLGGGTYWQTTRTLRYYLDKYHQFDASSGSLGMDDVYGGRVAAFQEHLARHLQRGLWCRIHFHAIGEGLGTSEANLRAALDVAKKHQSELWIAGMADIYKYQTERNASKLRLLEGSPNRLRFEILGQTDIALFDQPLTITVTHPQSPKPSGLRVRDAEGHAVSLRSGRTESAAAWCFDVAPRNAVYSIEKIP